MPRDAPVTRAVFPWQFIMAPSSSVGAAIDGQARAGDVASLWPSDEGDHCRDVVYPAVALQRRIHDLWRRPVASGGVEVGVDRAGLDVVDGDAARADLTGETLGEHFHRALGRRIGDQTGRAHALTDA